MHGRKYGWGTPKHLSPPRMAMGTLRALASPQSRRRRAPSGAERRRRRRTTVREIKRHFRFRGFATNIEIKKSRLPQTRPIAMKCPWVRLRASVGNPHPASGTAIHVLPCGEYARARRGDMWKQECRISVLISNLVDYSTMYCNMVMRGFCVMRERERF